MWSLAVGVVVPIPTFPAEVSVKYVVVAEPFVNLKSTGLVKILLPVAESLYIELFVPEVS